MAKRANYSALKYLFIFRNSDNIWGSMYDFERDIVDFFAANQLEVEPIQTVEGSSGERILIIKKLEEIQILNNKQDAKGANQFPSKNNKPQKSADTVKNLTNSLGNEKKV